MRKELRPSTRLVLWVAAMLTLPAALGSCTPEEEKMISDALIAAVIDSVSSFVGFVLSFARQGLAAFLF